MTDAGQLRVGHREREATVVILRSAATEGRLTPQELAERTTSTLAARTFADLDALVADLPVVRPSTELRRASAHDPTLLGMDPDHRRQFSGGMSSHVERGVWWVPPFVNISAGMGSVKLDFLQAICPHQVVDVAVSGGVGSVVLVLPDGWGANTDQVGKGMGSVSNRVDRMARSGHPLLVLHGSSAVGSITVRHANWFDGRRLRKAERVAGRSVIFSGEGVARRDVTPQSVTPQDAPPQDAPPQDAPPRTAPPGR